MKNIKEDSLAYHRKKPEGKLALGLTKPASNKEDLAMAYSPGVAYPCLEIVADKNNVYEYTWKGNTVAVISDGTSVLGLGNIGAAASLPVMEGKALLLKKFADINGIPIVIDGVTNNEGKTDVDKFVRFIRQIAVSFGAINLEDIAAPECFVIEDLLQDIGIPVFHDDQHGTAIVVDAGIRNAVKLRGISVEQSRFVISGAGAAGIRIAEMLHRNGAGAVILCDSQGVVYKGRGNNMNVYKEKLAVETNDRSLADALIGADYFIGVSKGDILTDTMIKSMADRPVIFALANPVPEIMPNLAYKAGAFIVATGRSDFPNQVNNVLAFPGIFRGALDSRAGVITDKMKDEAARAIAEIACENSDFGVQAIIPSVFNKEVVNRVAKYIKNLL